MGDFFEVEDKMKLSQCKAAFGICIIDLFNVIYAGFRKNFGSLVAMLVRISRQGAHFIRTGAMRGFFEFEFTAAGRKAYNKFFPILNVAEKPKINPLWLDEFRAILQAIKAANLLPYIFLIGGCDYPGQRTVLLDPRIEIHWPALKLYMRTVVAEIKSVFGMDFLLETGNELYVLVGSELAGAQIQVRMADYLYSLGVPYGQIRLSGLDGGHKVTCAEWLQVAAFGPENLDEVTDPEQRRKYYLRKGLDETGTKVIADRLGISLHEVGYPADVLTDGSAGRARYPADAEGKNGIYQNYKVKRFGPIAYSNDGVKFVPGLGYQGNTPAELGPVYEAIRPDLTHPDAGGVGTFETLPQDERTWTPYEGIPAGKHVEDMNFGPKMLAQIDALAKKHRALTGKEPYNKAHPVADPTEEKPEKPDTPEPVTPTPGPAPTPTKEDELNIIRLFGKWGKRKILGLSLPWPSIRFKAWLKAWPRTAWESCKFSWDTFLFMVMAAVIGGIAFGLIKILVWIL